MSSEHKPKKEKKPNEAHPSLRNSQEAHETELYDWQFLLAALTHQNERILDHNAICFFNGYPFCEM